MNHATRFPRTAALLLAGLATLLLSACSSSPDVERVTSPGQLEGRVYVHLESQTDLIFGPGAQLRTVAWDGADLGSDEFVVENGRVRVRLWDETYIDRIPLPGGGWSLTNRGVELHYVPDTAQTTAARQAYHAARAQRVADAPAAAEEYVQLTFASTLREVYHSRLPALEPEALARSYHPRLAEEPDAFRRREGQAQLEAIWGRIEGLRGERYFRLRVGQENIAPELVSLQALEIGQYDFEAGGFPFLSLGCGNGFGTIEGAGATRGTPIRFERWASDDCLLKVPEDVARKIEGLRVAGTLGVTGTAYLEALPAYTLPWMEEHLLHLDVLAVDLRLWVDTWYDRHGQPRPLASTVADDQVYGRQGTDLATLRIERGP